MVSFMGIRVAVFSGGKELTEYPDPELPTPTDRTASVYLEAQPGSEFKLRITASGSLPDHDDIEGLRYETCLDGVSVDGSIQLLHTYSPTHTLSHVDYYSDGWKSGKLRFEKVSAGPDSASDATEDSDDIGIMSIAIHRLETVTIKETPEIKDDWNLPKLLSSASTKGSIGSQIDMNARIGGEKDGMAPTFFDFTGIDPDDNPLVIFNFKYRSRRALQALGIIGPREPLEERVIESLSLQEARTLLRQKKQCEEKIAEEVAVKIEPGTGTKRAGPGADNARKRLKVTGTRKSERFPVKTVKVKQEPIDSDDELPVLTDSDTSTEQTSGVQMEDHVSDSDVVPEHGNEEERQPDARRQRFVNLPIRTQK